MNTETNPVGVQSKPIVEEDELTKEACELTQERSLQREPSDVNPVNDAHVAHVGEHSDATKEIPRDSAAPQNF